MRTSRRVTRAAVPYGALTGSREALELRGVDAKRYRDVLAGGCDSQKFMRPSLPCQMHGVIHQEQGVPQP